jgi:hypothetical protein
MHHQVPKNFGNKPLASLLVQNIINNEYVARVAGFQICMLGF